MSLGEGRTRLRRSKRLAERLGLSNLYLKDETTNPTGSFKDRPILVGLSKALEHEARAVAAASSGNATTSLAAGAAKAGLLCFAFVPEDIPDSKAAHLLFYGASTFRLKKSMGEDPTVETLMALCRKRSDIIPIPSFGHLNPYQIEEAKSVAFELSEQF